MQNEQEKPPVMIRNLFIVASTVTLALVAVGSLSSARMASTQLIATEGQGAAHAGSISEGKVVSVPEIAGFPQPGRMPRIALGR